MSNTHIAVVIPSYNEADVILETISPLVNLGYTVIVVDDCSTDETEKLITGLNIHYLKHCINCGQGAALQTGMDYAISLPIEYIVHFDADGQHDYKEIPNLIKPLIEENADVALGSRFLSNKKSAVPIVRYIVLKLAIIVNGLLTGLWFSDAHNGFRAFKKTSCLKINLKENRMAHATEILSQIKRNNFIVKEIPVHIVYSEYSKRKGQRSMNAIHILLDLILRKFFKMSLIKLVLIIPLIVLVILYVPKLKDRTFYRILLVLLSLIGVVFVINPNLTQKIAELLGVGRGADLIFYIAAIFFFIVIVMLWYRVRSLEEKQTELIRIITLHNPVKPKKDE